MPDERSEGRRSFLNSFGDWPARRARVSTGPRSSTFTFREDAVTSKRGLEPIRMGQLREGDTLVRFRPPIGNLRVTRLVKGSKGHLMVHYLRDDGSPDMYPTWTSTHAFVRRA